MKKIEINPKKTSSLLKHIGITVYDLALKLEDAFNYPQDVEWAIKNDVICVLQTRPITTLKNIS